MSRKYKKGKQSVNGLKINPDEWEKHAVDEHRDSNGEPTLKFLTKYTTAQVKIDVLCLVCGHKFSKIPRTLVGEDRDGCNKCVIKRKREAAMVPYDDFMISVWEAFGSTYIYTLARETYRGLSEKFTVICSNHGAFEVIASEHIHDNKGCDKCTPPVFKNARGELMMTMRGSKLIVNCLKNFNHKPFYLAKKDDLVEAFCQECVDVEEHLTRMFAIKSWLVFGDNFSYADARYKGYNRPLTLICKIHAPESFFKVTPARHFRGDGCPKCMHAAAEKNFVSTAQKKYGPVYEYLGYRNNNVTMTIKCLRDPDHKPFKTTPNVHLRGKGCPECRLDQLTKALVITLKLKHGDKYDYAKTRYKSARHKITVTCKILGHDDFDILPQSHLAGRGCWDCGRKVHADALRKSKDEFVEQALLRYAGKCDYTDSVYIDTHTHMEVRCLQNLSHGMFRITPEKHLRGYGCQKCGEKGWSRAAINWLDFMEVRLGKPIRHAMNKGEVTIPRTRYRPDGFMDDPYPGTVLEFHGDYWHGNPNLYDPEALNPHNSMSFGYLYERTIQKQKEIERLGYTYIFIWENDWRKYVRATTRIQKFWKSYRLRKSIRVIRFLQTLIES